MDTSRWIAELVVGIDFGMTCTGVAWSKGPGWSEPRIFQHWPGKMINELANKVPTVLQYMPNAISIRSWGFQCNQDGDAADLKYCFKLHLDPAYKEDWRSDRPTTQQARKWYQDYLHCLHHYISEVFSEIMPRWKQMKVEFVFSVPTTWKNPNMVAEIEQVFRCAGFGSDGEFHRAKIGLTEAEAAAVYVSKQHFEKGDVILVCDAGGGTTDVNILRLASGQGEPVSLEPLTWVEGRPIGSIAIDSDFRRLTISRLSHIQHLLTDNLEHVATLMMREGGLFERMKCSFGTALSNVIPAFPLRVPGLAEGVDNTEASIENSSMIFSRQDLQNIFNIQVDQLLLLINEQLYRVEEKHAGIQVSYLVLSGGLGSSAYVRDRLRTHFVDGPGSSRSIVKDMVVARVEEPQLAVVQGLVTERVQSIGFGVETFTHRCSRQSYGIVCREEYKPESRRHRGQPMKRDPYDGKMWVEGQIQWFITQGQLVSTDGVAKPFSVLCSPGREHEPWKTQIVMSSSPKDELPTNIQHKECKRLCQVSSILKSQEVDMKLKNRHWYSRGPKHWRFRFDVKAMVGSADLHFVILTKDKKVISGEHNDIHIAWQAGVDSNPL